MRVYPLATCIAIDEQLDHVAQSEVRVVNHLPLVVKGKILSDGELLRLLLQKDIFHEPCAERSQ